MVIKTGPAPSYLLFFGGERIEVYLINEIPLIPEGVFNAIPLLSNQVLLPGHSMKCEGGVPHGKVHRGTSLTMCTSPPEPRASYG
eukprot:5693840-Amphidinium_carterae.1